MFFFIDCQLSNLPQNQIFVTDVQSDFIRVFDYDGAELRRISLDDPRTGLALAVSGLCFVPKQDEEQVTEQEDEEDNTKKDKPKKRSKTQFEHPNHDLVVVDELNHVVHRFDPIRGGSSLETLLLPTDELGAATAISTTPEGHLAVVESGANTNHCFKVFRHRICECHQMVDKSNDQET